jgi:anti-sigma B factor antagonist
MKTLAGQGEMVVCGISEELRMLFSITKLDRGLFRIFDGRAEALNGF